MDKVFKSIEKGFKNDRKLLPRFFKYIGNINSVFKYEEFKEKVYISLINWFLDVHTRTVVIFLLLYCLQASKLFLITTPNNVVNAMALAEGISISWYLLVELKRELWRK